MSLFYNFRFSFLKVFPLLFPLAWIPSAGASDSPSSYAFIKGHHIYFEGEGNADMQKDNRTQRRSLAQQAAILDAQARIAFYVQELKTKKGTTLWDEMSRDAKVERRVKAFIKGAEIVKEESDEDDNCKVLLRINKKELSRLVQLKE